MVRECCTEGKNTVSSVANILQQSKRNKLQKVKRIYEDDTWVVDLIDGNLRVSCFEDYHFVDEVTLSKEFFK